MENIQNHFRKIRQYMFAYLEVIPEGSELEKLVKKYKLRSSLTIGYHIHNSG